MRAVSIPIPSWLAISCKNRVENWAAPFVLVMTALLVWWAPARAHGLGLILAHRGNFDTWREFCRKHR